MSVTDFREEYAHRLGEAERLADADATMRKLGAEAFHEDLGPTTLLDTLANPAAPEAQRLSALQHLQTATFDPGAFAPYQAEYQRVLRAVAGQASEDLRRSALDILANARDPIIFDRLLEGLRNAGAALVSPTVALQLLSQDDHGRATEAAKAVFAGDFAVDAKVQALRLLSTDPKSRDLIEKVLLDKDELRELRQAGATALRDLSPTAFNRLAQRIVVDDEDFDDIRDVARTGLKLAGLLDGD